jgi:general secretion pathway protein D
MTKARRFTASPGIFALCILALCIFALSSAFGQAPAPPAPAQAPAAAQTPAPRVVGAVNFNNQPLIEVINALAQELHINYILDASIHGGTVTINTYGAGQGVELRPLFETILRMNNLAMVQAGDIFRIVPLANISRQPIDPLTQADPSKIADDERLVLNLIFLRYATSSEMTKVLAPFIGDGGQLQSYDPANLLIILDNSRNMKRTLELIALFDSDTFAGQRVRAFEVKNGRPTDIAKELDQVFKAYSLSGGKDHGAVQFLPIDRVNTIIAVAPNPGTFTEVEKWVAKLDIPSKVVAGSVQNNVYKLKYGRAEILGAVINQLYGGCAPIGGLGGAYGIPGNSTYPSQGYVSGLGATGGSSYGSGGYGASPYGGTTSPYGGSASPYSAGAGAGFGGGYGQQSTNCAPGAYGSQYGAAASAGTGGLGAFNTPAAAPATPAGTPGTAGGAPAAGTDQTGSYLQPTAPGGLPMGNPRIIANPFDNTLIVQSTPDQWEQIKGLLEKIDVSPRQVLIEAKIYEVDLTGNLSAGVEAFLQQKGATNSAGITGTQLLGTNGVATAGGIALSAGTLVGQSRQLLAMLNLSETRSKAKVLSSPSVIATDSIPASITVGDSVPTLTSQAVNPGITTSGNSLFTQTVSNTSTGIGLNILARVNSSGIVTMVINQDVTAPVPTTTSSINSPSFSQRNVSTQVTVQDGDTIAIGGIIMENSTDSVTGIPLLDRIPYLGFAFGSKTVTKQRTELIVFLTPRVIYDTNQISEASQELKDQMRNLRKMVRNDQK